MPANQIYLFFAVETATLRTRIEGARGGIPGCRDTVSGIVWDSDGHALNFIGFEEEVSFALCDPVKSELHDRIAAALRENDSWEATPDSLVLIGSSRVRLQLLEVPH